MTLANIHCLLCLAFWQESYLPFPHPFSLDQGATLSSTLLYFRSGRTPLLPWSLGGYCPHWDLRSPCAVAWPPAPLWWWPNCSSWGNPKLCPPVPVPPDSLGWWSFLRPPAAAALPAPWSGPRPPPLGLPRAASSACRRSCSRASCRSLAIRSSCSRWFSAWFQAISSRGSAASCSALRSARTPARASCAFLRTSARTPAWGRAPSGGTASTKNSAGSTAGGVATRPILDLAGGSWRVFQPRTRSRNWA